MAIPFLGPLPLDIESIQNLIRSRADQNDEDDVIEQYENFFHSIIADLKQLMQLVFCLYGLSVLVFFGEIIVFKWKNWYNREHQILYRNDLTN